jgi:transcriptional regulator with PAS, ATPase and Fis domain
VDWLRREQYGLEIHARSVTLASPIDFAEIYQVASCLLADVAKAHPQASIHIHLSPGTPTMQAVWVLLGKSACVPVQFVQSSIEQGVQLVDIPFDIAAEFRPAAADTGRLMSLAMAEPPRLAQFDSIQTQNPLMQHLKQKAAVMAARDIPVLIEGETGTGKELFARAIHNASDRAGKPFVAVNCGAIPPDLIDSELFGHKKGSFTGAIADKQGYFAAADGGTIFLDEFGELPKPAQVRLLRVLQDGTFTPVGETRERKVDVRLIAATNRHLLEEIAAGRFREDLFYRVAVGILTLPPLRERDGDVQLLANSFLAGLALELGGKKKKLSVKAKNLMKRHRWPGNARELYATLLRACLWAEGDTLTDADVRNAMLETVPTESDILGRQIGKHFDIQEVMSDLAVHYLERAMAEAGGNKTKAAELLGLSSYQTLNNWLDKYGVK